MTGNQPTPGTGIGAGGETTAAVDMEGLVRACGVRFCRAANPDRLPEFVALLKEALDHSRLLGVAVVIARQPCAMVARVAVGKEPGSIVITGVCTGCGVCVHVCPLGAIRGSEEKDA